MYARASAKQSQAGEGGSQYTSESTKDKDEDVVDADFEEVKK